MQTPLFYKQKPLFSLDIGHSTVKVVQLCNNRGQAQLVGYGYADFDPAAIKDGVVVDTNKLASALRPLLKQIVIGKLTTDRVVASIPTAHIFMRLIELQGLTDTDIAAAVELEAQQYVPLPIEQIYIDYSVLEHGEKTRVLMVASPKTIVDSYIELFGLLNLEVYGLEPSLLAILRAVNYGQEGKGSKIIIDFGSDSSDLAIYDGQVRLTSTIATGGNQITEIIASTLNVDREKAQVIKSRFGIASSKWQQQLAPALAPVLTTLSREVQKMLRYHHERTDTATEIVEIIIVGGGANLPGLSDFLTHLSGIPVAACNPWSKIAVKPLQPPHQLETTLYATAVGLALKELKQ